jgi:hypothetical protein
MNFRVETRVYKIEKNDLKNFLQKAKMMHDKYRKAIVYYELQFCRCVLINLSYIMVNLPA